MMCVKNKFIRTISALIFVLMTSIFCSSSIVQGVSSENNKLVPTKYNIMSDKVWKISFNKEIDLNAINYDNVKVYDKTTDKAISINIIKDYKDYKSFQVKPSGKYTKGRGYRIEIMNIKTRDNNKTLKPTKMDFYIKNIYSGLPGEKGLVIIGDKAYAADYLLNHSKEVNEIILNKGYDVYFTNDAIYESLSSILQYGYLDGINVGKGPEKMIYIDEKGKNHVYIWDAVTETYKVQSPSINLKIVVRSDVKLISVTPSNLIGVPGAKYYKLKHSSSIKAIENTIGNTIENTIAYTSSDTTEEISILASDKTELAKGYFNIQANMTIKCYLDTFDEYGAGNTSGNINNNGIVGLDANGFIYYSNPFDKEALYKMGFDGVFNKKISEGKAQYINISKDYIYYSNYSDGGKLYKSELDGSKSQLLVDDKAAYITLSGEYIYYSNHSEGGKLYKVKKDGSEKQGNQVVNAAEGEVAYISIDGEWIYYINHVDGHKPYVMNKAGTYKGKLSDEYATSLQVYGDSVYYCSGGGVISKVKKDGTGGIVPIRGTASEINKGFHINVLDEWLYYSNSEDANKLYKIKTDGSGEKVKLSEDSVGYINIVAGYIYYNTTKGKMFRVAINGSTSTKPEEVGGKPVIENILDINNLRVVVSFEDVNKDIKLFLEKKYLPEKVAAIMGDNIMKQLVVVWDTTNVSVKNGIRTYKGNAVGYNKTITLDLVLPSEMLNDTNDINIYNNNGKNDTVEVLSVERNIDSAVRRIQDGEIIRVYSDEERKYKLGEGKVTREKKVLIEKLDLDAFGKSIWITITRIGKAESAPTEVKQVEAPTIKIDAARDKDYANLGLDVRDFSIGEWKPSAKNPYGATIDLKQSIYIVPSKTALDMKNFQAKEDSIDITNYANWKGEDLYKKLEGDKLELRKLDSKKTLFKAQNYDVYIATKYSGEGMADSDERRPHVNGMISSDTPSTVMIKDEALPKKPIILEQRVQAGKEITLAVAPALGETAWLVPVGEEKEELNKVKGWKWEDKDPKTWIKEDKWDELYNKDGTNPYDAFKGLEQFYLDEKNAGRQVEGKDVTKLIGDGFNKIIKAPLGMKDGDDPNYQDKKYKLFIVNGVGASTEGGASLRETDDSIIVDNQKSTLTILSNIIVKAGESITIKTSENKKNPEESEEARVFIVSGNDNAYTINQLENSVKAGNGKVIKVQNQTSYKIDTTGLEATCDNVKQNYTIVVVDNAGNVSPVYYVSVMVKTDELKILYDKAIKSLEFPITASTDKGILSKMNTLSSYLPTVERILFNNQGVTKESQKNITAIFNNLKSKTLSFIKVTGPVNSETGIPTLDLDAPLFAFEYPSVNTISSNSVKLDIKARTADSQDAKAYYVVMKSDSRVPDHELIINELNKASDLVIKRGVFDIEEKMSVTTPEVISGLESAQDYIIYIVLADDKLNYSKVELRKFTTK